MKSRTYEIVRNKQLAKLGITEVQYGAILAEQNGLCAICKCPPKKNKLSTDHNHITGRVRGLLCIRCNILLGNIEKNPALLEAIQDYRERWESASR